MYYSTNINEILKNLVTPTFFYSVLPPLRLCAEHCPLILWGVLTHEVALLVDELHVAGAVGARQAQEGGREEESSHLMHA